MATVQVLEDNTLVIEIGAMGPPGPQGIQGAAGVGVPVGGTAGQVLAKVDGTDYNTAWSSVAGGSSVWGAITGTLSAQTDLQGALDGKSATTHNHDSAYVSVVTTPTTGNFPVLTVGGELDNSSYNASSFATASHNHAGVYEPANANIQVHVSSTSNPHSVTAAQVGAYTSGAVDTLLSGKSDTSHSHTLDGLSDVVITTPATGQVIKFNGVSWINDTDATAGGSTWGSITGTLSAQTDLQSALDGKSATTHNHTGVYQPLDADLTAIGALVGTSGILKKTAADTWTLDTNTYSVSTHDHTGVYEPANANIQAHVTNVTTNPHSVTAAQVGAYTSAQVDTLLTGYSVTSHNHAGVYEPAFTKNTAFNKDFGSIIGTVCQGNDARLSDARTPTAHTHVEADITNLDKYSQAQVNTLLTGKSDTTHLHTGVYQPVPVAGSVQTTNATATVVQTIVIPTDAERIVTIRVRAHEDATDAQFWKTMTLGVKNIAGTASFVGGVDSAVGYDASASTWTVVAGVSLGNVTVTVTGEALKTINWVSSVETY